MVAIDAAMPGSWSRVAPFLQRLPALRPDQKAAAVNLGIFPDPNGSTLASASAPAVARYSAGSVTSSSVTTDRLAGIDDLLRGPPPASPQPTWQPAPPPAAPPVQVAYAAPVKRPQARNRSAALEQDLAAAGERVERRGAAVAVPAHQVAQPRPVRRDQGLCRSKPRSRPPRDRAVPRHLRRTDFRRGPRVRRRQLLSLDQFRIRSDCATRHGMRLLRGAGRRQTHDVARPTS